MSKELQDECIDLILQERERQEEKFGHQDHRPEFWLTILSEEVGEMAKEILESRFAGKLPENNPDYRAELVQVAAVALAMLENSYERVVRL